MKRFIILASFIAASLCLGVATMASAQETQTPEPTGTATATNTPAATATATSTPNLCVGVAQSGGSTITIGQTEISLPGGSDFTISAVTGGFEICVVDANASVTISTTCAEIDRDNPDNDPGVEAVLDDVVDSCERVAASVTPTPGSQGSDDDDVITLTPTRTSQVQGTTISPPSTGDAGLK